MGFPKSKTSDGVEYDSILILIDCFIKLVHYYPIYKIIDTTQLIKLLFRIFAQIGPLNNIVSNRGSVFISEY
jgi:hypothetical protein